MHQCLQINSWSLLVLGLALPLFQLCRRERRGARREQPRQEPAQQRAASGSDGDSSPRGLPHGADQQPVPQHRQPGAATHWLLDLYMLSCLAWFALHVASQLWLWLVPAARASTGGGIAAAVAP